MNEGDSSEHRPWRIRGPVLWGVFFLVCMGLGYPTLNRYDPRQGGNTDAVRYHRIVTGESPEGPYRLQYRALVPWVARPFYWAARGRVGTWEPALFGLLVANAIFCATTAWILVRVAYRCLGDYAVAVLGGALYLLSFAVSNFQLAGLVDSAEAATLMAMTWAVSAGGWAALPLLGAVGALAKDTFVPLGAAFVLGWWLGDRTVLRSGARLAWLASMMAASVLTLLGTLAVGYGRSIGPFEFVASYPAVIDPWAGAVSIVTDRTFWYVFGWLLPLGVWRLGDLPRGWVLGAALASLVAVGLGARVDSQGNAARAVFSATGPLLSLSVTLLLVRHRPHGIASVGGLRRAGP